MVEAHKFPLHTAEVSGMGADRLNPEWVMMATLPEVTGTTGMCTCQLLVVLFAIKHAVSLPYSICATMCH